MVDGIDLGSQPCLWSAAPRDKGAEQGPQVLAPPMRWSRSPANQDRG